MGILYIIATPLGNLGDITLRALEILKSVDLVVCEDTRQSIKLLNHFNIAKPLVSYFQHSKLSKIEYIAEQLAQGKNIALVTDAGTPGISDPGGQLVSFLVNQFVSQGTDSEAISRAKPTSRQTEELKIVPIPGPCAAIAALSICGFPTDKFNFMGFPPHKKGRETYFKKLSVADETVVFYESTHRILKAMEQLKLLMPERQIVVAREITKMFESIYRGTAEEILTILNSDKNNLKGEFVIVVKKHE